MNAPPSLHPDQIPTPATPSPISVSIPTTPFRFLDLPAELRVEIYTYILPHNSFIWFEGFIKGKSTSKDAAWDVYTGPKDDPELVNHYPEAQRITMSRCHWNYSVSVHTGAQPAAQLQMSMFLVNRLIYGEARAVLYETNTFRLRITGHEHKSPHIEPLIFGPLGLPHQLHLLRHLRSIDIEIDINQNSLHVANRHCVRLTLFVKILDQYISETSSSEDPNKKGRKTCLLKYLKVRLTRSVREAYPQYGNDRRRSAFYWRFARSEPEHVGGYMFSLEALATLRGIEEFVITGVPEWFARCLQLCIQGKGAESDVPEIQWPVIVVKRKRQKGDSGRSVTVKRETEVRSWWQPVLDWREFARLNEVQIPREADRFFEVDQRK